MIRGSRGNTNATVDVTLTRPPRDRMTRDEGLTRERRERQPQRERRHDQHEYAPRRRQNEARDVVVADHRLACREHDPFGEPAHDRREDRDAEQLDEQMKSERLAPPGPQIAPREQVLAIWEGRHWLLPEPRLLARLGRLRKLVDEV